MFIAATEKNSILFIYSLFSDLVSASDYIASYDTMMNDESERL
jgi:cephalosporin hydroxylase